jgi:hypothetical protein
LSNELQHFGSIGDFELEVLGKLDTKWDKTSNGLTKIDYFFKNQSQY